MNKFDDLSGQEFGIWKVLKFDHMAQNGVDHKHGMSYYACECKVCGVVKLIARSGLKQLQNRTHIGCGAK